MRDTTHWQRMQYEETIADLIKANHGLYAECRKLRKDFNAKVVREAKLQRSQSMDRAKSQLRLSRQRVRRKSEAIDIMKGSHQRIRKKDANSLSTQYRDLAFKRKVDKRMSRRRARNRDWRQYKGDNKMRYRFHKQETPRLTAKIKKDIKDYQGCVVYIYIFVNC